MLNGSNVVLQTDGRVVGSEATRTKSSTRRDVITAEQASIAVVVVLLKNAPHPSSSPLRCR